MQLIAKTVKGNRYWYLVQKGRRGGVVTNVKTIYLGSADRLAGILTEAGEAAFPISFSSWEVGASAALIAEARILDLVGLIDQACPNRRSDAKLSFGQLITILAIQRAIAPVHLRSQEKLRTWYESCGIRDLLPLDPSGLDPRRVDEALGLLRACDLDRLETALVATVLRENEVSRDVLAFDTSNFDSYTRSANPSQLLKRGHAKSKRTNLRVLGLGLLVTADDEGLPLLWFVYPGNQPDTKSFRSFLSRLKRNQKRLGMDTRSTVVCDGGNICQETVERVEGDPSLHLVARLPTGHAPQADQLCTDDLQPVDGFDGMVKAKMLQTPVYGKMRTTVAVYSASMHASQLPGLQRDIKKAACDLQALEQRLIRQSEGKTRGKPLSLASAQVRAEKALARQHMADLYKVDIGGTDARPMLSFRFDEAVWHRIETHRLGRTVVITDRSDWPIEKIVSSLREQSHVEFAFRQLKEPQWSSAIPLRHHTDPMLRVHAFTTVLALMLSKLVVRRLKRAGIKTNIDEAMTELSKLCLARIDYGPAASPALKALAKERSIPPKPNALQAKMIRALGISTELMLGPTFAKKKIKQPQAKT
jgi:transposase